MDSANWKKSESESGYPYYVEKTTGQQQYDHPQFKKVMNCLLEYQGIKYSIYRTAFKIVALQKQIQVVRKLGLIKVQCSTVPPLRICSGVFARHQLSLSESSLSLDTVELEAVLADIYFAAEKEGLFNGDLDLAVDLLINLLLNVYDKDRKHPIRVLAAKTLLIILSEDPVSDKWLALANCCADHNGCVSPRRLASLLTYMTALPQYLGDNNEQIQTDVDSCFTQNAGMLGVSSSVVAEWGQKCASTRWLAAVGRVHIVRSGFNMVNCSICATAIVQGLKFKCSKCNEVYFCDSCYLYDKDTSSVSGHKTSHLVHEVVDGEAKSSECLNFIRGMKRFFFCTKTKRKKNNKRSLKKSSIDKIEGHNTVRRRKDGKPAIFTSTVGKASGNLNSNPASVLQDIITQLETQNKAMKELSSHLENIKDAEVGLKLKVDTHWNQISMQINRLKILKDNIHQTAQHPIQECIPKDENERPQAFDLFSPIPIVEPVTKVSDIKSQPRVLSLDSGNFSVVSKQPENLLTISGDALKPVNVNATSDSISTVSVKDITTWYNDTESLAPSKQISETVKPNQADMTYQSISATEQRFADDIRSVETSNDKMKELNADLDTVLDRLQQILTHNFAMDDSCFDNTQLRETANEMEGLLGTLIRGVEQRATLNATKGLV